MPMHHYLVMLNVRKDVHRYVYLSLQFKAKEDFYTSKKFNEADLRYKFIDPFFEALGWDVLNSSRSHLYLQDVIPEARIRIEKAVRRADYGMRIDGRTVFYVEAEAANRPLYAEKNVHQAKRYAWSSTRAELAILTNFQGFCVYDARYKPNLDNKEEGKLSNLCIEYTDYIEQWPKLWSLFAKHNVANGSIKELLKKVNPSLVRKAVDKAFLEDLDGYRLKLATDIYKYNKDITAPELNQATHHILNQIVFTRILEDRDIEPSGRLRDMVNIWHKYQNTGLRPSVHTLLKKEFRRLGKRFNGVIFSSHFSDKLIIPDASLIDIIDNLYPPTSPYTFDVIPVEVLGHSYEQYLGKSIDITDGQVKLLLKPEIRKAGVLHTRVYC